MAPAAMGGAMSKLVATTEAAEALEYARSFILRLAGAPLAGEAHIGSPFEAEESRAFVRNYLRIALGTVDGRLWLAKMALAGEPECQQILRELIKELRSRGEPTPHEFGTFEMELLSGNIAPAHWPGPKKKDEFSRNIAIALCVAVICDRYKLKPTGRSALKRSGCAVVGQALAVIGQQMDYETVKTIWRAYGHNMPITPGWVASLER
jgi:hypothetical protein